MPRRGRSGYVRRRRYTRRKMPMKKTLHARNNAYLGVGFPKKVTMVHKYSETVTLTGTSGAIASNLFSCNGMFDPNFTGAGHQPMGFDTLTPLYDHYCVLASRIKITIGPTTVAQPASIIGLFINDNTSLSGSITPATVWEQSDAKKICTKMIVTAPTDTYSLYSSWSARKRFGRSPLTNTDLQGTSSSNPTEQSYYTIVLQSIDASSTASFYVNVQIQYLAVWKELSDQAPN